MDYVWYYKRIRQSKKNCVSSKLIVFAVGFTDKKEVNIPFFYFEGGTNLKEMEFMGRTMVKLVTKKALNYVDNTSKDKIEPIIKLVKDNLQ